MGSINSLFNPIDIANKSDATSAVEKSIIVIL